MFHDSHVVKNEIFLNPSISSLELSWGIFHLKPSLRIVAIYGAYKGPKIFFILPVEIFSRLLVLINPILFQWVAGWHLIIWDVFHKTISSLFFSLLVFQQLRSNICCKRALVFYSLRSFHYYFCSGGIVMLLSSMS